jgi:hypothetical protein
MEPMPLAKIIEKAVDLLKERMDRNAKLQNNRE